MIDLFILPIALLATTTSANIDSLKARNVAPPCQAVRTTAEIRIDGVLSEPVWQSEHIITDFKQRDPVEGGVPSFRTIVRVAYDEEALYIGARMEDPAPDSILARLTRRDVSIPADRFSVYLDPYHDKRSGYYFLVNAAGTLFDGTLSNDGWEDASWDAVWSARATIDREGWCAEMRIPFSQLRFEKNARPVWGIDFRRVIQRYNEEVFLVYPPKNESGFVSLFPELVGMENLNPGQSIELLPYVTTKAEYVQTSSVNPFNDGSTLRPDVGADLRMGVGSKLTLNATVNPDFGQVEVDPAVVNLSDVESFFQEKRPFFVEGSANFNFGQEGASDYWGFNWPGPTFFYSRRIGRAPQGSVPNEASFTDVPVGTSILGAAKMMGKLSQSWNFGTLHALTGQEIAQVEMVGLRSRLEVEPLTYYGVTRALKEFKDRRQGIGFINTMAVRSFEGSRLREELNSESFVLGTDGWAFLDKSKTWVISGWTAASMVRGSQQRINALQQSSRHYFQRPDADHVEVDPTATSLSGWGSRYWLNKQKGQSFMNAAVGLMSPGFEVNDVGFMSRADVANAHVGGGYKWTKPTKHRKYQDVIGAVFGSGDFQKNVTWAGVWGGGTTEFSNNYSWEYKVAINPETRNTRRTRGGPITLNMPGYELFTYFDTDGKSKLFYFVELYGYAQPTGHSWNYSVSPGVEWKPASSITLRVGPGYARVKEYAQYVDAYADPAATETYGTRYVFALLDQTEVSANLRLNWSFTPNLSFQSYVQPLVSTGKYTDFKSLARGKSYDFDPIAYDGNPNFNFKSLRGNAVLRWEYMPGSTLFLVWTQNRQEDDGSGEFHLGPATRSLLDVQPDNIFLAKVTYYFNR